MQHRDFYDHIEDRLIDVTRDRKVSTRDLERKDFYMQEYKKSKKNKPKKRRTY